MWFLMLLSNTLTMNIIHFSWEHSQMESLGMLKINLSRNSFWIFIIVLKYAVWL